MTKGNVMETVTDEKNAPHIFMAILIGIVIVVAGVLFLLDHLGVKIGA